MGAFCLGLMGASEGRPGENERWTDAALGKARSDAANFLEGPADERAPLRLTRVGICSAAMLA